jgi:dUTP pyrophosphatase
MKFNVILDENAKMPTKAHDTDAGFDLYAPNRTVIHPRCSGTIDTGVHIEIPKGYVGFLKSKSGLNVNHGLTSEGVIDVGYTGSICVKLYNHSDEDYYVQKGDKISQLVILPLAIPTTLTLVDDLEATERGNGGFGSTGR